jgi:hypothetical protein
MRVPGRNGFGPSMQTDRSPRRASAELSVAVVATVRSCQSCGGRGAVSFGLSTGDAFDTSRRARSRLSEKRGAPSNLARRVRVSTATFSATASASVTSPDRLP